MLPWHLYLETEFSLSSANLITLKLCLCVSTHHVSVLRFFFPLVYIPRPSLEQCSQRGHSNSSISVILRSIRAGQFETRTVDGMNIAVMIRQSPSVKKFQNYKPCYSDIQAMKETGRKGRLTKLQKKTFCVHLFKSIENSKTLFPLEVPAFQ